MVGNEVDKKEITTELRDKLLGFAVLAAAGALCALIDFLIKED